MLKKLSKFLLLTLVIFVLFTSSFSCLAHETEESTNTLTTTESNEETNTTDEATSTTPEIYSGDLYLFGNELVMDKFVDGNVFILGNNVKITGQVNGSLYVLANQVTFDGSLIRYSIFGCANYVHFTNNSGTYESDVYIAANKLDTTWDSYAARDFKIIASDVTLKSAVGRDVDLICKNADFGEGQDIPEIFGDLRYTANTETTIPEGSVVGSTTYTKHSVLEIILELLVGFVGFIVTTLAMYFLFNKTASNFIKKVSDERISVLEILKAFGIGLATIFIVSLFIILLVFTGIGILLATILALLFAIVCIIAMPILGVKITNTLKPILKIEKKSIFYLVLVLVSIILYGVTLIPYAGILLGFIINVTSIGLIIKIFLPHKQLSDEEKIAIEESKKLAKEIKEKRKQEKLETKTAKKEEKLKSKESKRKDKENK